MNVDSLWLSVLGEIQVEVPPTYFVSFFKGTVLKKIENGVAEILCPNPASSLMLKQRFYFLIKSYLEKRLEKNLSLSFLVSRPKLPKEKTGPLFLSQNNLEKNTLRVGLNPNYSFESFAVSESNQMAYAAAQAVANKPGQAYNPLFLWGSTGVGKTHLMQALGRAALTKNPQLKLIYCTGEEFTNGIIEAIKEHSTGVFKRKYRGARLFLVDDVQFIAGRESVQMEFFHTFNSILQTGGQVVLTSDKPPREINKLEARLRSRFEGGLTIDVPLPNFELRTAILLIKAREKQIDVPIEIAKSLAANFEDVRALEGALLSFSTEKEKNKESSYQELVFKIINQKSSNNKVEKRGLSGQKVIEVLSSHFKVSLNDLKGKKRKRQIARPRQLLMYLLRQDLGLPYKEIGAYLGGRDHSTIIHGVEKISSLLPKNESLRENLGQIRRFLWG